MSRILKRPMFRRGGSSNQGIMTGLVDRKGYDIGGIDRERLEADTRTITDLLDEYAPISKTRVPYGQFGLNIASGMPITEALRDPYKQFTTADDARRALIDKRKQGALSTALSSQMKKAKTPTLKQGVNTTDQVLFGVQPGKTGYFSTEQLLAAQGKITPVDNRMSFTFDAESNTLTQLPVSEVERMRDNKAKAREIVGSVNTVKRLKDKMIADLKDTPTGVTGGVFGLLEATSDQFAQATQALGFNQNSLDFDINTSEKLDKYLDGKGITKGAANFAAMKSSVINLAYMLAKIKEPGNPRLSEGDIIRQMDRIKFGQSRDVFAAALNNIFEDEVIGARGQIEGYGLNPDDYFKPSKTSTEDTTGKKTIRGKVVDDNDPAGIR